jgi:hypothetical protein
MRFSSRGFARVCGFTAGQERLFVSDRNGQVENNALIRYLSKNIFWHDSGIVIGRSRNKRRRNYGLNLPADDKIY